MPNLVLACNRHRAEFIARQYGLADWKYVSSAEMSRGYVRPTVLRANSFYERDDVQEILQSLAPCEPNYIEIRDH